MVFSTSHEFVINPILSVQPIIHEEIIQPIHNLHHVQPVVHEEVVQPIKHIDRIKPVIHKEIGNTF